MDQILLELRAFAIERLPTLVVPIAILVFGWIAALVSSSLARRAMNRTHLDVRIATAILGKERAAGVDAGRWVGRSVFYIVLLFTLLGFLQAAQLTAASEPINAMLVSILEYLPQLLAAAAILLVGWLVATLSRSLLSRALSRWQIDRHIDAASPPDASQAVAETSGEEPQEPSRISHGVAEAGYWLVLLLFLPAVLEALRLEGLLAPVQTLLNRVLGFLPNIASALFIGAAGWLVARTIQRFSASALAGVGTDRLAERVGIAKILGKLSLSSLLGFVAYILVLIPVAIGALNALQLTAVTEPASNMLAAVASAVPAIFGALLVLAIAYAAGRLLSSLVSKLLNGLGFDTLLTRIGFARAQIGGRSLSDLAGGLVMIAVIYVAALEGAKLLGFSAIAALGSQFAILAGHIMLGLVIFGVGLFLAQLAGRAVRNSVVSQARTLSVITRVAIIGLAGGMALRQMGLANEIIELAFGLLLGAVAVAVALAFGLGGRDFASGALEGLRSHFREESPELQQVAMGGDPIGRRASPPGATTPGNGG